MPIELKGRWQRIDQLEISAYPHLLAEDRCYYFLERSKGTWQAGPANSIVSDFQKGPRFAGRPEILRYRDDAIRFFAKRACELVARRSRPHPVIVVPAFTSKPKSHPEHDDRLALTASLMQEMRPGEIVACDVLDIARPVEKAKCGGPRNPDELQALVTVTRTPAHKRADTVLVLDDVITTGGHFAACRAVLRPLFPRALIVGVFLARQKSESQAPATRGSTTGTQRRNRVEDAAERKRDSPNCGKHARHRGAREDNMREGRAHCRE